MEQLKHECGVALVRLLKPQSYYEQKYGTQSYALNKLYLMMEKQHNRGQEGAGIACVDMNAPGLNGQVPNSLWDTYDTPQLARAVFSMCIPSCVVTTGGPRTSVFAATST